MIGRIYRIIHLQSDVCYIGSTFNELKHRWQKHKQAYNEWQKGKHSEIAIYPFFKEHGIDQFKMVLVKQYEVVDRAHLEAYEQIYINRFRRTCVNRVNPIRIEKLYQKTYRAANRDQINEYQKQYYEANRSHIIERQKQQKSEKIQCDCGATHRRGDKARHIRSAKHQKRLQSSS